MVDRTTAGRAQSKITTRTGGPCAHLFFMPSGAVFFQSIPPAGRDENVFLPPFVGQKAPFGVGRAFLLFGLNWRKSNFFGA